jgi:hypothetical protein
MFARDGTGGALGDREFDSGLTATVVLDSDPDYILGWGIKLNIESPDVERCPSVVDDLWSHQRLQRVTVRTFDYIGAVGLRCIENVKALSHEPETVCELHFCLGLMREGFARFVTS